MSDENKRSKEWDDIVKDATALFGSLVRGSKKLIEITRAEIAKRSAQKDSGSDSAEHKSSAAPDASVAKNEANAQSQPIEESKAPAKAAESSQPTIEPKASSNDTEIKK